MTNESGQGLHAGIQAILVAHRLDRQEWDHPRSLLHRQVEPGQLLTIEDVELPDTEASSAWRAIERRVLEAADRAA